MPITKPKLLTVFAIILVAAVLFFPFGGAEFLLWDDQIHLNQNPFFSPVSWQSFTNIWTTPYPVGPSLYIPVTYSLWGLVALFTDGFTHTLPFLLLNLFVHLLNGYLVYRVLAKLFGFLRKDALLFGCLIFLFHPLQVESVVWMSGFKDMIWVTFALLTVLAALQRHYLLSYLGLVIAVLCKPVAVITPLLVMICEFLSDPQESSPRNTKTYAYLGSLFVVAFPFMLLTKALQPDVLVKDIPSLIERPLIALDAIGFYLKKVFVPVEFGPDYGRTTDWVLSRLPTLELHLPVVFAGLLIWLARKENSLKKPLLWASMIFVVPLLPVLGFVPFQFQNFSTVADRYAYLSVMGISLLGALAYAKFPKAKWVLIALLPCLMVSSYIHSRYWRNNFDFFTHALKINPDSKSAGNNLGLILTEKNQLKEALTYFQHVYEIYPDNFPAANNIGIIYIRLGEHEKAIQHFENNLKIFPTNVDAKISYGELLMQLNRDEESLAQLQQASEMNPVNAYGRYMYSQILWKIGQRQESLLQLQKAIEIEPFNQSFKQRLKDFQALLNQAK